MSQPDQRIVDFAGEVEVVNTAAGQAINLEPQKLGGVNLEDAVANAVGIHYPGVWRGRLRVLVEWLPGERE